MFSEFLAGVFSKMGKSCRPEFYSARGATTSDLNDRMLETIWQAISKEKGKDAAEAFVSLVEDMPKLSATDFLLTLAAFEGNGYVWDKSLMSGRDGVYAADMGSAWGTLLETLGGSRERDETPSIRDEFLHRHGRKPTGQDKYGYRRYGCFGPV